MNNDRREFLLSASSIGIGSLLLPIELLADITYVPYLVHTRSSFDAQINQWFYLYNADASQQDNLQLVGITDDGSNHQVEQFSLTLVSHYGAAAMPSGYYEVANRPFHLFIKYTHEEEGRQYYRASFSLLRQAPKSANRR